jgi:hypothetical protein
MPRTLVATLAVLATLVVVAPAGAATHRCASFSARAGGVDQIRVTDGFKCSDVMQTLGFWANRPDRYGPPPWKCTHRGASVVQWRCHIRTSFGATKPLRTYRLRFRFLDA